MKPLFTTPQQQVNACALYASAFLCFCNDITTEKELVEQQERFRSIIAPFGQLFRAKVNGLSQVALAHGAGAGLALADAFEEVGKIESLRSTIHAPEPPLYKEFDLSSPQDRTGEEKERELLELIQGAEALGDTQRLEAFLSSNGVVDALTVAFNLVAQSASTATDAPLLVEVKAKIKDSSQVPAVTLNDCQAWLDSSSSNYPRSFIIEEEHHYTALFLRSNTASFSFNSANGQVTSGTFTELLDEVRKHSSVFSLREVHIRPKMTFSPSETETKREHSNTPQQDIELLDGVREHSSVFSLPEDHIRPKMTFSPGETKREYSNTPQQEIEAALRKYKKRIDACPLLPSKYETGFWFFSRSRGLSRHLNHLLVNSLLEKMDSPDFSSEYFRQESIQKLRKEIISSHPSIFNKKNGFVDRGIHSDELNKALQFARTKFNLS